MNVLTPILLMISNALLIPDILFLLFFCGLTIFYLGGIVAEAVARWRHGPVFWTFVQKLKASAEHGPISLERVSAHFGLPQRAIHELREAPMAMDKTLDDLQLLSEHILGRLHLGIRLGPIFGLAGTLIPLGPALEALSQGDIATLSAKLIVAFTTAVLGLFIGGTSFVMYSVRRHWYMQDLNDIEFIATRMK